MTFNPADQVTGETVKDRYYVPGSGGSGTWQTPTSPTSYTVIFDKRGNLWTDGRKVFAYDIYNRLTTVYTYAGMTGEPAIPVKGMQIASYTYDGYGR